MEVGSRRDLVKSVRNLNLKMGCYYSLLEGYYPLYKEESINQYVDEHRLQQMKELSTSYKPDVFWINGERDYSSDVLKSMRFLSWLYNDLPMKDWNDKANATYFTRKRADFYLTGTNWQDSFTGEGASAGAKVSRLGYKKFVKATAKGGKLSISALAVTPITIPGVYAWVYKIEKAL